jgi:APA family basic amino acid/polyamine antiporter
MKTVAHRISLFTAISIVVANMIGTGVFTSLGFQLNSVQNTVSIMVIWCGAGIVALCGALAYAELGSHYPESGGDYVFLSRTFHPQLGYLSAWAGLTIGFSAPVALAAIAFVRYLAPFGLPQQSWIAVILIVLVSLMHSFTLRHSSGMQNLSTVIKIIFIIVLIAIGLNTQPQTPNAMKLDESWRSELVTTGMAVSMIFATYAYTGWNAAAYITDEINNPRRNLPIALITSTLLIIILYCLFQWVLLNHTSADALRGREDVSYIAFRNILGDGGAQWVGFFIALQLIATISSYLWVGPRVTRAMSAKHHFWQTVSVSNNAGIPVRATWLHAFISIVLVLTGSFEQILLYAGFVLQLMSALTVSSSLFIKPAPGQFRTPLKPLPQIIFLLFSTWVLIYTAINRPLESAAGAGMVLIGLVLSKNVKNMDRAKM